MLKGTIVTCEFDHRRYICPYCDGVTGYIGVLPKTKQSCNHCHKYFLTKYASTKLVRKTRITSSHVRKS